jgi:hypothetical protein
VLKRLVVKRLTIGLLIGLAVGLPAGATGWWAYSKDSYRNASAERELAGGVASEWLQRKCPFCAVAGFDRAEDKGWRLTIRTEDGQRLCYRMEIERFALNLDGLQSVQRTACDGAGWTNYVPLTP